MDQLKKLSTPKNYDKFDKKIVDKEFLMGKFYDSTISSLVSPACKGKHHNIKKFPKSKIRNLLDAQLKMKEQLKSSKNMKQQQTEKKLIKQKLPYQFYQPLNNLWCRYMNDLISKDQNQQSKQLKVLRADFHGAIVTVVSSKNQTLVGLTGIVIKQTLRTFQIVIKVKYQDISVIKQQHEKYSHSSEINIMQNLLSMAAVQYIDPVIESSISLSSKKQINQTITSQELLIKLSDKISQVIKH